MFRKILIANRGEIACRVMRTAHRLGIETVAVYSDADHRALHVQLAGEAVCIGPAPPRDSYLRIDRVIEAAASTGAEAIHPGYGFLSENGDFAEACAKADIEFIGPPAAAIRAMGAKSAAKEIMVDAGVPLLPGYHGEDQSPERLREEARQIGFPLLLKPSAGGGGKGMRTVATPDEFGEALDSARREAMGAFGDDVMLLEKYLPRPRHVEIQVFFDRNGNGVYLNERDCSTQRRHQKVIEEAPAPGVTAELRAAMGEAALRAAAAIDYVGAGTVEFLLDEDGTFYFMEMNTRLQVEHPVTEMTTGLDLVEWQLRVAAGERLPLAQDQVELHGHAFEARIYAEDPDHDFMPQTGRLLCLEPPPESGQVRVDSGVEPGDEISVYYDPLIAKLIVWDEDRERALDRLGEALASYHVSGVPTNIPLLYNIARSAPFRAADLENRFIERHSALLLGQRDQATTSEVIAAALYLMLNERAVAGRSTSTADPWSPWGLHNAWRLNEPNRQKLLLSFEDADHDLEIEHLADTDRCVIHHEAGNTHCEGALEGDRLTANVDGHIHHYAVAESDGGYTLFAPSGAFRFRPLRRAGTTAGEEQEQSGLTAPMNGTIVRLLVEPGALVEKDDPLLVMEAMKMEHTLRAPARGRVLAFCCEPGDLVAGGAELIQFEKA